MCAVIWGLAVVLALGGGTEHGAEWPPDVEWSEGVERTATNGEQERADAVMSEAVDAECAMVFASDVAVLGRVARLEYYEPQRDGVPLRGDVRTAIVIDVERCLRGECEGTQVRTSVAGGVTGNSMISLVGVTPPEVGERYIFCLHKNPFEPGGLRGGNRETSLLVEDDVVSRKGFPLAEFLAILERGVERRSPASLLNVCDAAVVGTVTEYVFELRGPPGALVSSESRNFVRLQVERVAKGEMSEGRDLFLRLPPKVSARQDVVALEPGDRIVAFLRKTEGGEWFLTGGKDAALSVSEDGRVGGFASVDELVASARLD